MKKLLLLLLLTSCTGQWAVHEENDYFGVLGPNTDHNYTQGLKVTRRDDDIQYGIGQNIYTPTDKRATGPVIGERPYAGYLYGERSTYSYPQPSIERRSAIQVGVVGPASLGKQAQCGVHGLLDQACPAGWDNQIANEPALNYLYEQKTRKYLYSSTKVQSDFITNVGFDLGNVSTLTRSGFLVRIGKLPTDFGPVLMSPRAYVLNPEKTNYYIFFGPEVRAVARNIFLDGNTFEDSHSVDKKPIVADLKAGFGGEYNGYRLQYTLAYITPEWEEDKDGQVFGAIDIAWGW